jgi:RNA polymerase-binding transcription factor DksA
VGAYRPHALTVIIGMAWGQDAMARLAHWEEWVVEEVTRLQHADARGGYRPLRFSANRRATTRPRVGLMGERSATLGMALRRLEREHVALLLAIAELETPGAEIDDTTRAINEALRPLLRDDLRRTQHALTLATLGRYGACEICGQPLSRRQLELAPTRTRCPGCETRAHLQ